MTHVLGAHKNESDNRERGRLSVTGGLAALSLFTLSQAGMVRHWRSGRPPGRRPRAALNGLGAPLTGVAAIVVTVTKFPGGGWLIVVAVPFIAWSMSAVNPDEPEETKEFIRAWELWAPDVNLALVNDGRRRLVEPIVGYVRGVGEPHVVVLIPEVEPVHVWQRVLQNQRGALLAHALRRDTDALVRRLRFRLAARAVLDAPGRVVDAV